MSLIELEGLLDPKRSNALVAWVLVSLLVVVGLAELADGDYIWSVFGLTVAALALVPPLAHRSSLVMLPWEVLVLAALPAVGLALGSARLTGSFAVFVAVAAVALVVAVELELLTTVRMTPGFAVVFVVVATMAAGALWALFRFGLDGLLDTETLPDHDAVMWEFVYSALAGVGAGVVFEVYFRRSVSLEDRVPAEAVPEVVPEEAIDE